MIKHILATLLCCFILSGCATLPTLTGTPEENGVARAKADLSKGTMQILYYGKPWSQGKPLVDDQSGLPIKIVAGCCVTPEFVKETDAYNQTMRNEAKQKIANKAIEKLGTATY